MEALSVKWPNSGAVTLSSDDVLGGENIALLLACLMAREESMMRPGKEASQVLWEAGMQQVTTELHMSLSASLQQLGRRTSPKDAYLQIRSREGGAH